MAELRHSLYASSNNQVIGKVYIDTGEVKRQAHKWKGLTGDNQERINSAGLGLNWTNSSQWGAALTVGFPIGSKPKSSEQPNDVESWFTITKHF